jgi:hypothetical protein
MRLRAEVGGRRAPDPASAPSADELGGEVRELHAVHLDEAPLAAHEVEPAGVGPAAEGVVAHADERGGLAHAVAEGGSHGHGGRGRGRHLGIRGAWRLPVPVLRHAAILGTAPAARDEAPDPPGVRPPPTRA